MEKLFMDETQLTRISPKSLSTEAGATNGSSVIRILQRPSLSDEKNIESLANDFNEGLKLESEDLSNRADTLSFDERKKKYELARLRIFGTTEPSEIVEKTPPMRTNCGTNSTTMVPVVTRLDVKEPQNQFLSTVSQSRTSVKSAVPTDETLHQFFTNSLPYQTSREPHMDGCCNSVVPDRGIPMQTSNSFKCPKVCGSNYVDEQEQLIALVSQISRKSMQERQTQRFVPITRDEIQENYAYHSSSAYSGFNNGIPSVGSIGTSFCNDGVLWGVTPRASMAIHQNEKSFIDEHNLSSTTMHHTLQSNTINNRLSCQPPQHHVGGLIPTRHVPAQYHSKSHPLHSNSYLHSLVGLQKYDAPQYGAINGFNTVLDSGSTVEQQQTANRNVHYFANSNYVGVDASFNSGPVYYSTSAAATNGYGLRNQWNQISQRYE